TRFLETRRTIESEEDGAEIRRTDVFKRRSRIGIKRFEKEEFDFFLCKHRCMRRGNAKRIRYRMRHQRFKKAVWIRHLALMMFADIRRRNIDMCRNRDCIRTSMDKFFRGIE